MRIRDSSSALNRVSVLTSPSRSLREHHRKRGKGDIRAKWWVAMIWTTAYGHDMVITPVNSQEMWLPAQNLHKSKSTKILELKGLYDLQAPPHLEELLTMNSCCRRENQSFIYLFILWGWGHWYVSHVPMDDFTPVRLWATLSGLPELLKSKATKRHNSVRGSCCEGET